MGRRWRRRKWSFGKDYHSCNKQTSYRSYYWSWRNWRSTTNSKWRQWYSYNRKLEVEEQEAEVMVQLQP